MTGSAHHLPPSLPPSYSEEGHSLLSETRHHQRVMSVSNICRVATAAPSPAITSGGKSDVQSM